MRIIIDLENSQASRLDAWAKVENISRAEAVRRAVNLMLERVTPPQGTGFGLWKQSKAVTHRRDGLVLQQALRDEWPE